MFGLASLLGGGANRGLNTRVQQVTAFWLTTFATVGAFLLGSLPFAVWLGKLLASADVRSVGDGNPGTANAFKAGGLRVGVPTLVLEVGKAGIPVWASGAALGLKSWALLPVAAAPLLGHAFSPFLKFRGGKAIAATFGSWLGLTGIVYPLVLGLAMGACFAVQSVHAWAVIGGVLLFGVFLAASGGSVAHLVLWSANLTLLVWTHRRELSPSFRPRGWLPVQRSKDR